MDETYYTTEHRRSQHLLSEERHEIEVFLKLGWSIYRIAKEMGRPYNTIKNEIKRGTVSLYHGRVQRYRADKGYQVYLEHRKESRRKYRCLGVAPFLNYVVKAFREQGWSLDSCVGKARASNVFNRSETVCTRTLYRYVDLGLLPIRNIDLPEKLRRNTKRKKINENKRILGRSIEERPESIESREEFGHWEIDSVLGKRDESAVLSLTERKLRVSIWLKVKDHSAEAAEKALKALFQSFGSKYTEVFKSITADNGSEFANLAGLEEVGIKVFFTHPYSSFEKGTVECHNRMLRRFLPKGKSIDDYTADEIMIFADLINALPRKRLGYRTPEELFDAELDRIFAA